MGKNNYILLPLLFCTTFIFAKANQEKFIVYFKDKPVDKNVASLFSEKALEKRKEFNIKFDERDYKINTDYLEQIKAQNAMVLNNSNWLNAILISANTKAIKKIKQFSFVTNISKVEKSKKSGIASLDETNNCENQNAIQDYEDNFSSSFPQFHLLNGEYLHEQGYNGENMTIAICDGGFIASNTIGAFDHLRTNNRILGTYNFVNNDSSVYESISHGTNVLSCIAGKIDNEFIGSATNSKFYLFITENAATERLQEEFNLATALERCSQLGVDVVNISLGYTTFDVATENHDTSDMMKNNTPAAKAVNIASSKGILVVAAAGNEGNGAWHYISTPSDADSAFCIAAVDANGNPASFSGYGLATDTRVKPNVAAVGWNTKVISTSNQVVTSNGTSFASPSLAGLATCLWQAFPGKTNWEIKTAIEQSASQYHTPDKKIGYGIPDFQKAYTILFNSINVTNKNLDANFFIYPNPFQSTINITHQGNVTVQQVTVLNSVGQAIYSTNAPIENTLALNNLSKGMYLLEIATDKGMLIKKIIKE